MLTFHGLLIWLLLLAKVDTTCILSQGDNVDAADHIVFERAELELALGNDLGGSNVSVEVEMFTHSQDACFWSSARVAYVPLGPAYTT